MSKYTPTELLQRNHIIKSQVKFIDFLDAHIINKLVDIFDENNNIVSTYIENERKLQGLNTSKIIVKSEIFGLNKNRPALLIKIIKDDIEILHISFHLVVNTLNANKTGIIHIYKNIYEPRVSSRKRNKLYALIEVTQPINKPRSLEFKIADGYNTPINVPNSSKDDPEIQKEMDVIITVLNRLFDEDNKEYYIGIPIDLYHIHKQTNFVLKNINNHTKLVTRKNKGIKMFPELELEPIKLNRSLLKNKYKSIQSKNSRKYTRKFRHYSL